MPFAAASLTVEGKGRPEIPGIYICSSLLSLTVEGKGCPEIPSSALK